VRAEVRTRLQTLGRDGGLIIGPTHNIQLDTPLENFWAMVNTIQRTSYDAIQALSKNPAASR
jgi:uroporphyrinogen-III decarboxylase